MNMGVTVAYIVRGDLSRWGGDEVGTDGLIHIFTPLNIYG